MLCFIVDVQAQDNRLINVEFQDTPLASALRCLEREGGKNILFVNDEVKPYNVTAHIQNQTQFSALEIILEDKPFTLLERKDYFVHECNVLLCPTKLCKMRGISRVRRVQYCLRRNTDIVRRKTGAGKRAFQVRKIENWFSVCKPHVGANKKYV